MERHFASLVLDDIGNTNDFYDDSETNDSESSVNYNKNKMKLVPDSSQNNNEEYTDDKAAYDYADDFHQPTHSSKVRNQHNVEEEEDENPSDPAGLADEQLGGVMSDQEMPRGGLQQDSDPGIHAKDACGAVFSDITTECTPIPRMRSLKKNDVSYSEDYDPKRGKRYKPRRDTQSEIVLRPDKIKTANTTGAHNSTSQQRIRPPWQDPNASTIPTDNVVYFKNLLEAFGKPVFRKPSTEEKLSCNRPYHTGLNRRRQLERIQIENYAIAERIKNAKTTPYLRRDMQLREHKLYFNANWAPEASLRQQFRKRRPNSAVPYFEREAHGGDESPRRSSRHTSARAKAMPAYATNESNEQGNCNNNAVYREIIARIPTDRMYSYGSMKSINTAPHHTTPSRSMRSSITSNNIMPGSRVKSAKTRPWRA